MNKLYTPFFFLTNIDNLLYPTQDMHVLLFQDNDCKCAYLS